MRWLCLFTLIAIGHFVFAQEKEVVISDRGVTTNANKNDAIDPLVNKISSEKDTPLSKQIEKVDTLLQLKKVIDGERVFSQQQWKVFKDSLERLPSVNLPELKKMSLTEITDEQMLKKLNEKFFNDAKDSLFKRTPQYDSLNNLTEIEKINPKSQDFLEGLKMDQIKLPESSLNQLKMLPGKMVKSKYLEYIDSVRFVNLKDEKLKLKEKVYGEGQLVKIKEMPSFWDKTYMEGVLGFTPGNFTIIQFAPTLAYHLTHYLSLGVGPNILIQKSEKDLQATVGVKTLMKIEFFKRRVYAQMEDIMDSYGVKANKQERKTIFEEHNVFVGGGFLLSTKKRVTLNFSILYCLNKNQVVTNQFSPLVFRIGLSSLNMKSR